MSLYSTTIKDLTPTMIVYHFDQFNQTYDLSKKLIFHLVDVIYVKDRDEEKLSKMLPTSWNLLKLIG